MARPKSVLPDDWTLGDLLKHFGGICAGAHSARSAARHGDGA